MFRGLRDSRRREHGSREPCRNSHWPGRNAPSAAAVGYRTLSTARLSSRRSPLTRDSTMRPMSGRKSVKSNPRPSLVPDAYFGSSGRAPKKVRDPHRKPATKGRHDHQLIGAVLDSFSGVVDRATRHLRNAPDTGALPILARGKDFGGRERARIQWSSFAGSSRNAPTSTRGRSI